MRFSTLASAALAATVPALAAADKGSLGFSLGNKKSDGSCKTASDYEADFKAITSETDARIVRIYAASDCDVAKIMVPIAAKHSVKVVLGIWADEDSSFQKDKAAAVAAAGHSAVYAVTVGSESLYRGNFTGKELADRITDVRKALPQGTKVGTADSWNKYADGTADPVVAVSDILLANAFSYWQGQTNDNATASFYDDIYQAFSHVQKVAGDRADKIELWVGETGWPTAGDNYQKAHPGLEQAGRYFHQAICGMVKWGFQVFSFEAFDEEWKPPSIGQDGSVADETAWGVMTSARKAKFELHCSA